MTDADLQALLARVERLEALEQIKELKQGFAMAADPNMKIDQFLELYAEDGVMEIIDWGRFEGHSGIRAFLEANPFQYMFHCLLPIQLDLAADGRSATGRWYLFEAATVHNAATGKEDPVWVAGVYDDDITKVGDRWKFKRTRLRQEILTTYEAGWRNGRLQISEHWKKPIDALVAGMQR